MNAPQRLAAPAPPKPPAPPAYQRTPGNAGRWLDRASADFALAGKIEKLGTVSENYFLALVRDDPGGFENLSVALQGLINRHSPLVEGARALHDRIAVALAGGANSQ